MGSGLIEGEGLSPVGGVRALGVGRAIPLRSVPPSWFGGFCINIPN